MRAGLRAAAAAVVVVVTLLGAGTLARASTGTVERLPAADVRGPEQTFLTFPEWYLVFSPAEYSGFLAHGRDPSEFPLYSHIGQFWQSYAAVCREFAGYPFNGGYHAMVLVIGTSTTVEYGLKGLYEHTIGRLAEATKSGGPVPEEAFAASFAQAYVDFIRIDPWYRFDFLAQLKILWTRVPTAGPDMIRKYERRFALTSELLVKEGYARLIKLGTQSLYDAPQPVTAVQLSRTPTPDVAYPEFRVLGAPGAHGEVLATVPRYEAFTRYSLWLARQGIDFSAIAGNSTEVVVSELVPMSGPLPAMRLLFEQPVLTQPGRTRRVFATPVARLGAELRAAKTQSVVVEHIFDF